jgi:hypothetical protein
MRRNAVCDFFRCGNAFNGSINGYDGQGRASELDYIDDEW